MALRGVAAAIAVGLIGSMVWWARTWLVLVTIGGRSMEPTLRHGDRVLVYRVRHGALRVNDLVVLESPFCPSSGNSFSFGTGSEPVSRSPPKKRLVAKRIVAVKGEAVPEGVPYPADITVPTGTVVVLGDNRAESQDSRHYGPVSLDKVLGVIVVRLVGMLPPGDA